MASWDRLFNIAPDAGQSAFLPHGIVPILFALPYAMWLGGAGGVAGAIVRNIAVWGANGWSSRPRSNTRFRADCTETRKRMATAASSRTSCSPSTAKTTPDFDELK